MTATEPTLRRDERNAACGLSWPDPARLAAVAILSAAGASLAGLDLDAATAAMRRELGVAGLRGAE